MPVLDLLPGASSPAPPHTKQRRNPVDAGSRRCFHIGFANVPQRAPLRFRKPPEQILGVQSLKARFGDLATALGGVDLHARQLIEPLNRQDYRLAVPVGRQQAAGVVRFSLAGEWSSSCRSRRLKCVKIFCGSSHIVLHFLKLMIS